MVTLFLMTYKGFRALNEIVRVFGIGIIDNVIADEDNNVKNDYYNEIRSFCKEKNIRFFNRKEAYNITSTYSIAISWRWLINSDEKIIVLHDSLLPKYRGFNPLVTALIKGDTEIGVTALFAEVKFDAGEIICQSAINISYPIKIDEAIEMISHCYTAIVVEICTDITNGKSLTSYKQNEEKATFSLWRDEEDYRINWNDSAECISRFIDAVGYPYQGATCMVEDTIFWIRDAVAVVDLEIVNRTPGKVIYIKEDVPYVVCGKGILKIHLMHDATGDIFKLKKTRTRFI